MLCKELCFQSVSKKSTRKKSLDLVANVIEDLFRLKIFRFFIFIWKRSKNRTLFCYFSKCWNRRKMGRYQQIAIKKPGCRIECLSVNSSYCSSTSARNKVLQHFGFSSCGKISDITVSEPFFFSLLSFFLKKIRDILSIFLEYQIWKA